MGWWNEDKAIGDPSVTGASWQYEDEVIDEIQDQPKQPEYTEEQKRKDFASYKKNLALASEWKKSGESYFPGVRSYAVQTGAPFVAGAARLLGQGELADQMSRTAAASEQVQQAREAGGPLPDWLQRAVRGAGVSLTQAGATGMLAGPYGIIGAFSASEGNRAWTEGADAGLKGKKLAEYVLKQATIEALPATIMQRLGLGGLESILGRGGKQAAKSALKAGAGKVTVSGLKAGAKQAGKTMAAEQVEEAITEMGHLAASTKIDPDALSVDSIIRTLGDTAAQTFIAMGAASAPGLVSARRQGKRDKAKAALLESAKAGEPMSSETWKAVGLPKAEGLSRSERMEAAKQVAAAVKEFDAMDETIELARIEKTKAAIVEMAKSDRAPSVKWWGEQGLPKSEGKSRVARRAAVLGAAAEIKAEKQAIAGYQEAGRQPMAADVQPGEQPGAAEEPTHAPVAPEQALGASLDATSIANAAVAAQREQRGEDQLPRPEPETTQQWLDDAKQQIKVEPNLPARMVKELSKRPSPLSAEGVAVLQVHYRGLQSEFTAARKALRNARSGGDESAIELAQERADEVRKELGHAEEAYRKSGTEQARGLVARKMGLQKDYSLGGIVDRLIVAKGGRDLDAKESAKAETLGDEIADVEAQREVLDDSIDAQDSEAAVERFIDTAKPKKRFKKRKLPGTAEARERVNRALEDFKAVLARKEPKGGAGEFISEETGAVDVELVESGIELAKAYANLGVSTFAEFFSNVKTWMGDAAMVGRDSLRVAWAQAQAAGLVSKPEVNPENAREMNKFARKVARSVVESGTINRDEVVDAIHEELRTISPDISRRQAMDAISGYGIYSELSKDEVSATIRDLSGQLRQLSKLEDIQGGKVPEKTGVERRTLSDEELQLTAQVKEAMRKAGFGVVSDAVKTAAYKKNLKKRITDLKRRIEEGDFSKPVKRFTKLDKEATELKYQAKVLRDRLDAMEEGFRNKQMKGVKKFFHYTGEVSNLGRAMKTSFDLSALMRQGKAAVAANPKLAWNSTIDMVRAYWSKNLAFVDAEAIRNHPRAVQASQGGLALTSPEGKLSEQEEAFRGTLSRYIPGVAGSERAYSAGLNRLRMDFFSQLMGDLESGGRLREGGEATDAEVKAIANVVNVFTGRGSYGSLQYSSAAQLLSTYIFSPRFIVSRFQFLVGQPMWGGSKRTRTLAAEQYARAIGSISTMYALVAIGGLFALRDEDKPFFEWDWRSTAFGKIRWGETVWDPLAGLGQIVTFSGRMSTGETKASTGEIIPVRGPDVPFKGVTISDVITRFVRTKLAPLPSAVWNTTAGEDVIGRPTDAYNEMIQFPIPLSSGDVYDALRADGYVLKTALPIMAILGEGVKRYQNANPADFARKIALHPELEGTSERTGKDFNHIQAVNQMIAHFKKRGYSESKAASELDKALREAGRGQKSRRASVKRFKKRVSGRDRELRRAQ